MEAWDLPEVYTLSPWASGGLRVYISGKSLAAMV